MGLRYGGIVVEGHDSVKRAHPLPSLEEDLMCWCPESEPCHADVLLRLAAEPPGLPPVP